jgi:hypothetical protein
MSAASDARNKRLDDLQTATNEWAQKQTDRLNNDVAVAKAILKGRTGSERLASAASSAASDLVLTSINDFLSS